MLLQLENIEKSFGDKKVLEGITFSAESGKAFGILGRNGAGKTTTIRILMDVFSANKGKILIDGKEIDHEKIKIGYLPEERGLYPKKIIFEQLLYFATLQNMSKKEATSSIDYWLDKLNMKEYRNKRLDTLSKGNQQKIQLITAIAHNPDIVILDEPFSGLDPVNAQLLKDVVKELISKDKIVLFSSHQMNYIEEFCSDIAIINKGKIAINGNLNDIKYNYVRDKLVVKSKMNHLILNDYPSSKLLENGSVMIYLDDITLKSNVMKNLVEKYDIDEVKVYEPTLNDIFVEYTTKEDNHETV